MIFLYFIVGYLVLGGVIVLLLFRHTRMKETLHAVRTELARVNAAKAAAIKRARQVEALGGQLASDLDRSLANTADALQIAGGVEELISIVTQPAIEPPRHRAGQYHHHYQHPYPLPEASNGQHGSIVRGSSPGATEAQNQHP
jgi:hypothetical protein